MTWFADAGFNSAESAFAGGEESTNQASEPGSPLAILQLYDQIRDPLHRYLLCLRLNSQEAEDVVQESFLRLHSNKEKIRAETVRAWLFRVAHNLAVSLKRRDAEVRMSAEDLRVLADARAALGPLEVEEKMLKEESLRRVRAAVLALPEQQQRCLHLRAEGLRYREISQVLGLPISTVANQLQRATGRLIEVLNE
ncbi:RNA polymerase sigma factor [uncultured Paludibaculum sp.]|uniref:RNA polymerase sigma factor n=1 Tax=uncultured Paludibaculum sp. TaxID=1765020 RepID=UPI002AAB891D|nr:RNA polymerase sigma factor [uncultured Paludibaculum sp.]